VVRIFWRTLIKRIKYKLLAQPEIVQLRNDKSRNFKEKN